MTLRTNSRLAGYAFLVYIASALTGFVLAGRAASGEGAAAKLASIAQHAAQMRAALVLELIGCFCALALAVTLHAITRDEDRDIALLAAACRLAEGIIGAVSLDKVWGRLWLGTAAGAAAPDPASRSALAAYLLVLPDGSGLPAIFFAVGSTLFAALLLRGRIVPVPLAWLGVVASVLAVIVLPLALVGIVGSPITDVLWLPMLVFEVWLALRLIVRGAVPARRAA